MGTQKFMAVAVDRGQILIELVQLYAPTEREAAQAVAEKTGGLEIDLSRAGEGDHLPRVLLFELGERLDVIVQAVHKAAERQRQAIARLQ